jgi:hypothetical protein
MSFDVIRILLPSRYIDAVLSLITMTMAALMRLSHSS